MVDIPRFKSHAVEPQTDNIAVAIALDSGRGLFFSIGHGVAPTRTRKASIDALFEAAVIAHKHTNMAAIEFCPRNR